MSIGKKLKVAQAEMDVMRAEVALMRAEHRLKMAAEDFDLAAARLEVERLAKERDTFQLELTGAVSEREELLARVAELEQDKARLIVQPNSPLWLIAAERIRQQNEEGWTPEHDDKHDKGEMAAAAGVYAMPESHRIMGPRFIDVPTSRGLAEPDSSARVSVSVPVQWPWDVQWWKPTPDDRLREIIKAAALLVAEYERLSRAAIDGAKEARP